MNTTPRTISDAEIERDRKYQLSKKEQFILRYRLQRKLQNMLLSDCRKKKRGKKNKSKLVNGHKLAEAMRLRSK